LGECAAAEFSAVMVQKIPSGDVEAKVFVKGDKVRVETAEGITITRMDRGVVWVLMPSENMYMETAINREQMHIASKTISGETERQHLGRENILGRVADKYRVTRSMAGRTDVFYQWIDQGGEIPLKIEAADGSLFVEYRDIKERGISDSLFEIPSGYSKMSFNMPSM
jgi:hypothetical protein